MCTGEVERKVWMRLRLAGLIASAQRSMSLKRGARQAADHRVLGALGDLVHGGEIAFRGDREAGLDDVDAHRVEQLGDFELLLVGHGGAGALLAVAQGGVEDDDAVLVGLGLWWSWRLVLLVECAARGALRGCCLPSIPRVPRRKCPAGPQGRISRRSVPRMRVAAEPACAARSIAQMVCRVDIALRNPRVRRLRSRIKVKSALTACSMPSF